MIRWLAVIALAIPSASLAQSQVTIGTTNDPVVGTWAQSTTNGIVGQTIVTPQADYLTGFRFLIDFARATNNLGQPSSLFEWTYRMALRELPASWDGVSPFGGPSGSAAFGTNVYESQTLSAPLFTNSWVGVDGIQVPILPNARYALTLLFNVPADNSFLVLFGSTADTYGDGSWYFCGPCGGGTTAGPDLVFEADFVSVPEPGAMALTATGLLMLLGVGWRRRRAT